MKVVRSQESEARRQKPDLFSCFVVSAPDMGVRLKNN
jgi:hypothetical protein